LKSKTRKIFQTIKYKRTQSLQSRDLLAVQLGDATF